MISTSADRSRTDAALALANRASEEASAGRSVILHLTSATGRNPACFWLDALAAEQRADQPSALASA